MKVNLIALLVCGLEQMRRKFYLRGAVLYCVYAGGLYLLSEEISSGAYINDFTKTTVLFLIVTFSLFYNLLDILDLTKEEKEARNKEKYDELYEKGRISVLKGDLAQAKGCFEELSKKDRRDMDSVYQLAKVYNELGNKGKAKKLFKKYLKSGDKLEWVEEAKEVLSVK